MILSISVNVSLNRIDRFVLKTGLKIPSSWMLRCVDW